MSRPKILLCLDTDPQPSVFDGVVAVDAGVDYLFRHGGVRPADVRDLVYGAMFTRGGEDLKNTAVFVGGSDVTAGEAVLHAVRESFFGDVRVSAMLDSNGSNTTAAAAVVTARRHIGLKGAVVTVLAATGPVGSRVVRLLARAGAQVRVVSRKLTHAEGACDRVAATVPGADLLPLQAKDADDEASALEGAHVVIACGPPGVQLVTAAALTRNRTLEVAIDLNAVPPTGLEGVSPADRAASRDGRLYYGAFGVGRTKMRIHHAAVTQLFAANDQVFDAEEIYEIGLRIEE
ncbi:MAG: bifunctional NADP-dependent methylenetetrahydromethanopterin dehydrogenase/methylenetetrahydrofolate dehydrogenase [Planctomycetaceae bacterium]|nr:bifunctional NADP-dependent methylenetetrahydromethanopterin dehydrogenase/methylenetetrahydrofolate dehydrogenase [Planctomycetaceae bacterium]